METKKNNTIKTILLERQEFAYEKINSISDKKTYKSYIENFGLLVYNNGLISAMATTKKKCPELYKHVKKWLHKDKYLMGFNYNLENDNNENNLLKNLIECNMNTLLVLTDEVIRLADTLKQFVKAEFKE